MNEVTTIGGGGQGFHDANTKVNISMREGVQKNVTSLIDYPLHTFQ